MPGVPLGCDVSPGGGFSMDFLICPFRNTSKRPPSEGLPLVVRPSCRMNTRWRGGALAAGAFILTSIATVSHAAPAKHLKGAASPSAGVIQSSPAVTEARAALDDNLLDYRATRFRQVRLVQTKMGYQAFCGELNTPNRLGGFSGWTRFVLPLGDSSLAKTMDKPTIQGQPTKMDAFLAKYGPGEDQNRDSSGRVIASECGETAQNLDTRDYADALTFK